MAAATQISRPSNSTTSHNSANGSIPLRDNKTEAVSTPLLESSITGPVVSSSHHRPQQQEQLPKTPTSTAPPSAPGLSQHQHQNQQHQQKSGGLFAFAASALDKTIAGISEPRVRPRQSLSRLSIFGADSALLGSGSGQISPDKLIHQSRPSSNLSSTSTVLGERRSLGTTSLLKDPSFASQPYSETDPNRPLPIHGSRVDNKMHQTSSRLLRMTDDDRPFTKDFKDLFSTLMVSLMPLEAHRVRLTKIENTFLSENAISNLGSLKFAQSNRMPDPKDPSRIVTTTTTTTFSMAKDMARSICQRFLEARFIESADGKYQQVFPLKGSVWQLTPKGICVLDRFVSRNGIDRKGMAELTAGGLTHLVILERDRLTDKLMTDRGTIEVIFRRFVGANGYNVKPSISSADSESLSDYRDGLTGVKMAPERKVGGRTFKETFTGKAACDWLLDCCTTVDRRETLEIASLFVEYELIEAVQQDRTAMSQMPGAHQFQPTKHAIYQLTAKAKDLINGSMSRGRTSESEHSGPVRGGIARDSNTQRLDKILNDAALRLLFRENLRETHCEENLSFYLDVDEFVRSCRAAIKTATKSPSNAASMDGIKEIMAQAYGIYNAFLAPGSPCELNIDHQLRNNLATRMTKAVGQDVAMIDTLHEVTSLFEDAQNAVFKLMASDSVPKFLRSPKYEQTLKNYDFDSMTNGTHPSGRVPERSVSRSARP